MERGLEKTIIGHLHFYKNIKVCKYLLKNVKKSSIIKPKYYILGGGTMKYTDEELIKKGNEYKQFAYGSLEEGMHIQGIFYEFVRQELGLEDISILLPANFSDMPLAMAKVKYPSEQRPDVIKTNVEGDINFTFKLLEFPQKEQSLEQIIHYFYQVIRKIQPANVFYEKEFLPIMGKKLGWFDFKSHAIDCKLYNLMYVIPIKDKLLHGIFNCPYAKAKVWKPVALSVISSLESEDWKGEMV